MTSLRTTIENFHAYIMEKSVDIEQEIVGANQDFKDTRLGVYHEGYFLRLLDVLSRDFPAVKKLLGTEKFEELGCAYIRQSPSTYFSVRYVGAQFAQFLADTPDLDPTLAEMAQFEWALENVIDAKDAPAVTFEEMTTITPENWSILKFKIHPSLSLLPLHYPTPPLWQHILQNTEKPDMQRAKKPVHWLIWRFDRKSFFRPLDANQLFMIRSIQKGKTFSDVCTGLCKYLEEDKVISFAASTLRTWITEGIFSAFMIGSEKKKRRSTASTI